jgi:uncharacterized damage-inducible protein DinB
MASEVMERIIGELRRMHTGPAWHGPCLRDALSDLTATHAAARPVAAAHSIFELTHHIGAWVGEVESRLRGNPSGWPAEGDWPDASTVVDDRSWTETVARAEARHTSLIDFLRGFDASRLDEVVDPNAPTEAQRKVTASILLNGVVQHSAYHIGQIILLRRALGI